MAINRASFLRLLQQHSRHRFSPAPLPFLETSETSLPSNLPTLPLTLSAPLSSSASDPEDPQPKSTGIFSWLSRIKGAFTGTATPQPVVESPPISSEAQPSSPSGDFSLVKFADEIKKAQRFGSLIQFGKGLPRGGEVKVSQTLDRQESIARALACYDPYGQSRRLISCWKSLCGRGRRIVGWSNFERRASHFPSHGIRWRRSWVVLLSRMCHGVLGKRRKLAEMLFVHVALERNTRGAVGDPHPDSM